MLKCFLKYVLSISVREEKSTKIGTYYIILTASFYSLFWRQICFLLGIIPKSQIPRVEPDDRQAQEDGTLRMLFQREVILMGEKILIFDCEIRKTTSCFASSFNGIIYVEES